MEGINFYSGRYMLLVKKTQEATFYIKTNYEGHVFWEGSLNDKDDGRFFLHSEIESIGELTDLDSLDWKVEQSRFNNVKSATSDLVGLILAVETQTEEST